MSACIACGSEGRQRRVVMTVLGNGITVDDVLCPPCYERVMACKRFIVTQEPGGWSVAPVDADNQPLLRRQKP